MSKITVTIKVSGPGECIGNEMLVIEKALHEAGYDDLEVINEFPLPEGTPIVVGKKNSKYWRVVLKAEHLPWGG